MIMVQIWSFKHFLSYVILYLSIVLLLFADSNIFNDNMLVQKFELVVK
jgi:hypothetical protein